MIKQLTSFLNYGLFAEIALAIFIIVFISIVVRTLLISREDSEKQAAIVLSDKQEGQQ